MEGAAPLRRSSSCRRAAATRAGAAAQGTPAGAGWLGRTLPDSLPGSLLPLLPAPHAAALPVALPALPACPPSFACSWSPAGQPSRPALPPQAPEHFSSVQMLFSPAEDQLLALGIRRCVGVGGWGVGGWMGFGGLWCVIVQGWLRSRPKLPTLNPSACPPCSLPALPALPAPDLAMSEGLQTSGGALIQESDPCLPPTCQVWLRLGAHSGGAAAHQEREAAVAPQEEPGGGQRTRQLRQGTPSMLVLFRLNVFL